MFFSVISCNISPELLFNISRYDSVMLKIANIQHFDIKLQPSKLTCTQKCPPSRCRPFVKGLPLDHIVPNSASSVASRHFHATFVLC
jgi:hypothetical protein